MLFHSKVGTDVAGIKEMSVYSERIQTPIPLMVFYSLFIFSNTGQVANGMLTSFSSGSEIARKWLKNFALSLQITSSQISHFNTPFSLLFVFPSESIWQCVEATPGLVGVLVASWDCWNSKDVECLTEVRGTVTPQL